MATHDDLDETRRLVEDADGRILTAVADVRDRNALKSAYEAGIVEFGHVDIVLPNAGIMPVINQGFEEQAWHDGIATMLTGVWHTMEVTVPAMIERDQGGAVIITSSTAGLRGSGSTPHRGRPPTTRRSTAWWA
jgi:NADP-dependent 3-hydroxy acid dehydrogenase YdfG